jgi:CheY-like chemotaxis protein
MNSSLTGARILVVEDEPFIAFDLVGAIEDAGGYALGPAATVQDALDLIAGTPPDGAILDVNLVDGHVGPVLDALPSTVSVVVHTGVGLPAHVRATHPDVLVYTKPTPAAVLLRQIASGMGKRGA